MADSRDGGDGLPLLRVRHALLRAWSLLDSKHLRASRPDGEQALALTHLDLFACQLQRPWQPREDAIVGDVAIPGDGCRSSVAKRSHAKSWGKGSGFSS